MNRLLVCVLLFSHFLVSAQTPKIIYEIDSAAIQHAGVPKGEIIKFNFENSAIFPGTTRECTIYVPAQYSQDKPACVYINQDGVQWNAPTVFDNLIYNKEMPVTIGVFVTPGQVKTTDTETANNRFNRSFEYDGLGNAYARFILEELLPEVEKHRTKDGHAIILSKKGNDRAIGGSSSGAVCAFTAAWEKPKEFSRIFSAIGTYVGLRGADRYPTLIRKFEPKQLRFFLQDGTNDNNIYAGDWWKANEMMERALSFSGYQVNHIWGEDKHNGNQGTAIFAKAMRYLWRDWPKPIETTNTKNQLLSDILIPGEDWTLVGQGYKFTKGTTVNKAGEVFFQDIPTSKTYKLSIDGRLTTLPLYAKKASGTCFDTDGKRYVTAGETKQIIMYDKDEKETVIADNIAGNDLIIGKNGNTYVTEPDGAEKPGKIYLIRPNGEKIMVDEGLKFPNGICFTPDQTQIYITESASHWVWIYSIKNDGTLFNKQRYGWLHVQDVNDTAWPDGIRCDTAGRVYVATQMGIQILDQIGRVNAIIPLPEGQPSNCTFGGAGFNTIYVTCGSKVYKRKLNVRGANSFDLPYKPNKPSL